MARPDSGIVLITGVAVIALLVIFTPMTWLMGLTAAIFMVVGLTTAENAMNIEEANETIGHYFCAAVIMLAIVSGATENWHLMLMYGLPMFIGLIYPMTWYDVAQTEQLQ